MIFFKPSLIGFIIGIAIGLTGVGGGVLVMPSLIYLLGIPPVPAVGTGLLFALVTRIVGAIEHHRLKNINLKTAFFFTIGSVPTTILSSYLVNSFSESGKFPGLDNFLEYVMGSVLILTAIFLFLQNVFNRNKTHATPHAFTHSRKAGAILAGALIGTLIGATSIGGGVLVIPILIVFFGLNPAATVGTSILISVICALAGSTVYLLGHNINFPVLIPMCIGSLPGVIIGSRATGRIPKQVLGRFLTAAVIAGIISLFWGARH